MTKQLTLHHIDNNGSYGCQRPIGAGFYSSDTKDTLIAWNGPGMDIYVKRYDHMKMEWSSSTKVIENNMHGTWDYHNYPGLIQAPNGKPIIFYAEHSSELYQLMPLGSDINGEWNRKTISTDFNCYPAPVTAGDAIYIFYSRNDDVTYPYRTYRYMKSMDNGATWSEPFTIIDSGKNDPLKFDEVYGCSAVYEPARHAIPERILLTWSMWGGPKGHAKQGKGTFFAYFYPSTGRLGAADGTDLGNIIDYSSMLQHCLIETAEPFEGSSHTSQCPVCTSNPLNGFPIVAYGYSSTEMGGKQIRTARWDGVTWVLSTMDSRTWDLKDMVYSSIDQVIKAAYYLNDCLIVTQSKDDGTTWEIESETRIPLDNGATHIPYTNFIKDHHDGISLLLGQINRQECNDDYSGKWSIYVVG
ncbi:sialidase family protein [Paenibacillus sp. strain BS8-2]